MVDSFTADGDDILVIRNNKVAFSTNAPSITLFDDAYKIVSAGVQVSFPNLYSTIYYVCGNPLNNPGANNQPYCETWSALLAQEHGYGRVDYFPSAGQMAVDNIPIQVNLAQILLGFVPAGTDYIDVRARLTRTINPPTFYKTISPPVKFFAETQWIHLLGGSCVCEFMYPLIRQFDVVMEGTAIYLRRYQSVANPGVQSTSTSGNTNTGVFTQQGASWGNYANAPVFNASRVVFFESKGPDANGNKRPPWGSTSLNSCWTGSVIDYQSLYNVDLIITPGKYNQ